ncbi:outer membrane protein with beta-barrel domain [Mucilaginibacter yixingensis]|uniref:Outer membrane protein with beta-barrel domain n=1 Tax=Mucilaginibacter yixingensis TaxID=1295612 RepID=A0A2T5JFY8_9SPHI|nr:porin family protein [Mucilaginibacter yixingensis]PTR01352.1 outer membrane protein with beta-barrel domain [Mucilaginibacter yixingensis]
MKKLAFCMAALLICSIAHAQRKFEYGFRIGGGISTQSTTSPTLLSTQVIRTFNASLVAEYAIPRNYFLQASVGINNKGVTNFEDALTTTNHITYLELTVDALHKFKVPSLGKFLVGAGFYTAMANGGTFDYETPNSTNSDKIAFGNDNDFRKNDAGLNLITGLELNNHLTFNIGYDFGLTNIASQPLKDSGVKSVYNRSIMVGLGLMF